MKRTLIILSTLLLVAATASAQERHGAAAEIAIQQAKVADFLQLTPDQRVAWDNLHAELQNGLAPLFDQTRTARQQLSSLLDSDSPDPTAVGTQMIAIHSLEKQIHALHDAALQKVNALLTPDQRTRFEAWRASNNEPMRMKIENCAPNCPMH